MYLERLLLFETRRRLHCIDGLSKYWRFCYGFARALELCILDDQFDRQNSYLPLRNEHYETKEFSELVEVGDLIHKGAKSDEIYLQKETLSISSETMNRIGSLPAPIKIHSHT